MELPRLNGQDGENEDRIVHDVGHHVTEPISIVTNAVQHLYDIEFGMNHCWMFSFICI